MYFLVTKSLSLSAYAHPLGDRSESARYECSINDCPDCAVLSEWFKCTVTAGAYSREINVPEPIVDVHQEENDPRLCRQSAIFNENIEAMRLPEGTPQFSISPSEIRARRIVASLLPPTHIRNDLFPNLQNISQYQ